MLFVSSGTMERDVFLCEEKKESASLTEIMSVKKKELAAETFDNSIMDKKG
jgi:hypothetical protein